MPATTVTFIAHKPGLLTGAALNHVGRLVLAGLDAPPTVFASVPCGRCPDFGQYCGGVAPAVIDRSQGDTSAMCW
jgi:hypothetical protein